MKDNEKILRTMLVYMQYTGTERGDAVCDMLADLMHMAEEEGYDFDTELERARWHYAIEAGEIEA